MNLFLKKQLIVSISCLSIGIFSFAQKDTSASISFLNKKRLAIVAGTEAFLYGGSLVGLNELWYKDYPRSSFHLFNDNEVNTIMFASTCKNIVLSHGTFSWLIGLLGFYSTIYYQKITRFWQGDIFVFPEWNEIL